VATVRVPGIDNSGATSRQCSVNLKRVFHCLVLTVQLILMLGCASSQQPGNSSMNEQASAQTIMLVGVVADSQGTPLPQSRWNKALEDSLREQSRYNFIAQRHVSRSLGDFQAELLADYHDDEQLGSETIEILSRLGLPARYLLFGTLDGPRDLPKKMVRHAGRNATGEVVRDRSSVTYYTSRDHTITGSVFDIYTGRKVWQRTLASTPVASRTFSEYHGSSFAGSVAAMFANRFVNGKESSRFPAPPATSVAMRELSRELIYQLFYGQGHI